MNPFRRSDIFKTIYQHVRMGNSPRQRMELHNRNEPCKIVNLSFRIPVYLEDLS